MNTRTVTIQALVVAAFFVPPRDSVARWSPIEGELVEWRWEIENDLDLVEVQYCFGYEGPKPIWHSFPEARYEVRDVTEITARDRLVLRDAYGPLVLQREFLRARRTTNATQANLLGFGTGEQAGEVEAISELEGAKLVFEWSETAWPTVPRYEEGEDRNEELLEGLEEELDLRILLGERSRRPGDVWLLDDDAARGLLLPGGELSFRFPDPDFDGEHETAALGWLLGTAMAAEDAEILGRATFERVSSSGTGPLAYIRLSLRIEAYEEVRDRIVEFTEQLGSGSSWLDLAHEIHVEHEIRMDGVLIWDMDAGRARSLELYGGSIAFLEIVVDPYRFRPWSMSVALYAELRGNVRIEVEAIALE